MTMPNFFTGLGANHKRKRRSIIFLSPLFIAKHIPPSSVKMSPASTNLILSDLHFAYEWDDSCGIGLEEALNEWLSDEEASDLNIMHIDEQIGANFLVDSIFGNKPPRAKLDSMDYYLESDEDSPASSQNFPFADNTYREAFKNLAESMKRSEETQVSLQLTSPVKQATQHWEEQRNSISNILASTEKSRTQIQQTYFQSR